MKKPISKLKRFYLPLLFVFAINNTSAQQQLGAKLTALGMSNAANKDLWSITGNIAGISSIKSPQLALNYTKYPSDVEWSNQAFVFVLPIKNNYLGLSCQRFGINEYNVIKVGFAVAKRFGSELAIGVKANYHQLQIKNYGRSMAFSVDVGAIFDLNEWLTFGIYVNNPSLQEFDNKSIEEIKIPSSIYIGTTYQASDKILITTTVRKDRNDLIDISLGIDYQLLKQLNFRGGLTTQPFKQYVGFGLGYKNIVLDFALESDENLGYIPQIGLAYAF